MAVRYVLSQQAVDDVFEIVDNIDILDVAAAERFENDLYAAFDLLVEFPGVGHEREDLTDLPVRFWPMRKQYMIVYQPAKPLEIVRVLSGYRDIAVLLDS